MRLSWNEVRVRASKFAKDWKDAAYEKGETQSFYNEFFEIFGVSRRSVGQYEKQLQKLNNTRGYIDLFWSGVLLVEQKSAGRNLARAHRQADDYFIALPEHERPQYILVSDFQTFELRDLDQDLEYSFSLAELPEHVEKFGFILGVQKRVFRDQDPVNIKASEALGELHDSIASTGYIGHDLERLLVRLVFCLFADDTGIFEPRDLFLDFLENRTNEDGSDLGAKLTELFQVLNTPETDRIIGRDEDLARFPYVNGEIFSEQLRIPAFDSLMRGQLTEACKFDWSRISPAIFGSLFQSVMDPEKRREESTHYTTERNILRVIEPLFLDNLRSELERLKVQRGGGRKGALRRYQQKLANQKFFDPACGCGNFLVITYREIRELELDVIRELMREGELGFSQINVDQFYGIEIKEFPALIAETALWIMDHIMNNKLTLEVGDNRARIPIRTSPHIVHDDALDTDWVDLVPSQDCSYVFGNPPFGGAKYQTPEQREQLRRIAVLPGKGGTLDYVTAWFIKASEYIQASQARIGFVATNSITQGEQVGQLWPILLDKCNLEISFAHRTFAWGSDARGEAHVHVVIIGLIHREDAPKERRLFSYPDIKGQPEESQHTSISPYLLDASRFTDPHLIVRKTRVTAHRMGKLVSGTQPIDNGHYIFNVAQREEFLKAEPDASSFLRPYVGSQEFIHGEERWILALQEASPAVLRNLPAVRERVALVRDFRTKRKRKGTLAIADYPTRFNVEVLPETTFLVVPKVSSERREYVPIGWLDPPTIPSDLIFVLQNALLTHFGLLTSAMHMAWLRHVGGRLESRYRYSIGPVYNTFPTPPPDVDLSRLEPLAQAVLDARNEHPTATLADLYDPDLMPPNLRMAHQTLDRTVDRLYRKGGFKSERERIEHLFARYEEVSGPFETKMKK